MLPDESAAFAELLRLYREAIPSSERKQDDELREMLARDDYEFRVALRDDGVVGFTIVKRFQSCDASLLEYMAVDRTNHAHAGDCVEPNQFAVAVPTMDQETKRLWFTWARRAALLLTLVVCIAIVVGVIAFARSMPDHAEKDAALIYATWALTLATLLLAIGVPWTIWDSSKKAGPVLRTARRHVPRDSEARDRAPASR
ncbi:MAG: hypothetical protein ABI640_16515 [Gammaproteobacteria bacterium]